MQEIINMISSNDEKGIQAGLLGLKCLVKKYEFEIEEDRQPLNEITGGTFGVLGGLINNYVSVESESACEIIYLVSKIFYVANHLSLCAWLTEGSNIEPWLLFFKSLLDRPLPPQLESLEEEMSAIEQRERHILWRTKGLAARITHRIFQKYGNPAHVEED
jgi:hypothetical protein